MNPAELIRELEHLGVRLWEEAGALRFRAPKGVLTESRRAALSQHKQAVLEHLRAANAPIEAHPEARHDPFPLTDVQAAYLLGRRKSFLYGGVGCHAYGELALPGLDAARLEHAWRCLIARHDMLRAVILTDGTQQVLRAVPEYRMRVDDLRGAPAARVEQALMTTREELGHQVHDPATWPLFELRATLTEGVDRLHVSIDFLIADYVSIFVLLDELRQLYEQPARELPALSLSFRDCLMAGRAQRAGAAHERDRAYWLARIDDFPTAPELPVLEQADADSVRFQRLEFALEPADWQRFARAATSRGLTPSAAVLAAYAEVIGTWSRNRRFALDLTLLNRPAWHPDVARIVGDFTSVELLEVDQRHSGSFVARAQRLQQQLGADLEHGLFSGVELIRELARRRGPREALMPIVYTSALGLSADGGALPLGEFAGGISQTPQVWIDCQAMERHQRLALNWDVRLGVFPPGLVETMFAAFELLVRRLAADVEAWDQPCPLPPPPEQVARRTAVNATAIGFPPGTLLDAGLAWARREPERVALLSADSSWTYGALWRQAGAVQAALSQAGVRPGEIVAVLAEKGPGQVIGVLGVLLAGAAYLPIDVGEPAARRDQMLADAGVRHALSDEGLALPAHVQVLALRALAPLAGLPQPMPVAPEQLAYVIYTSGSSGRPKGVMITHAQALNTIQDIHRRFQVDGADRVLCVSSLAFDLSVYDVFGLLGVGGALVMPSPERRGDPSHWAELVAAHGVTLWNSVPGLMGMLLDYVDQRPECELGTLRLALLSGDWLPVELVRRLRARLPAVAGHVLGGATEGSIWSITFPLSELAPDATFVPYGRPLANQSMHVLDAALHARPEGVIGEICIGGMGVALGYLGDPARTAERFVSAPDGAGRLYRTGDLGRCHPDGTIEILGRDDAQVKIRGQRVELGEIEAHLAAHPQVARAAVVATGRAGETRRLLAFVEPAPCTPPALPALAPAAHAATAGTLGAARPEALLAYARALDQAALAATLTMLRAAGLFAGASTHTADEVASALQAVPRHRRLVRRLLRAALEHGCLEHAAHAPEGLAYRVTAHGSALDLDATWRAIEQLPERYDSPVVLDYFRASGTRLAALLRDEASALELLYPQGRADVSSSLNEQSLFNRWGNAVVAALAARASESVPTTRRLRVLEVGAGLGGTTAAVLAALARPCEYWFTDVSAYFLSAARTRFADVPGLRVLPYDLNRPSREQGLTPNSFDLVIAGDVLHVARDVPGALADLRELLAPGGFLVALEMTRDHGQIMTSLELLNASEPDGPGYTDERADRDQTFFTRADWLRLLAASQAAPVEVLPAESEAFAAIGLCVFAARYKSERAALWPADLTEFLRARVPEAMLPAEIQVLDGLPLTANGKLDRQRLATWEARTARAQAALPGPESDLERRLGVLWSAVLGGTPPARDQDFFGAGGDSLSAAQLAGRMLEELPEARELFFDDLLRLVLQGPTLGSLAQAVATGLAPSEDPGSAAATAEWSALGGPVGAPACVLIHDGSVGTADRQRLADVLATRLRVFETALEPQPDALAEQAARCHVWLHAAGLDDMHLVGLGAGNALALELARHLLDAGQDPLSVTLTTLVDSERVATDLRYPGDLNLIHAPGDVAAVERWRAVCLGDLRALAFSDPQPAALARLILQVCGA